MKPKFTHPVGCALLLLAGFFPSAAPAAVIAVDAADSEVVTNSLGVPAFTGAINNALNLPGAYYAGSPLHYVAPVRLPSLGPGTFSNVTFTVTFNAVFGTPPSFNIDLYGVTGTRAAATTLLSDAANGGTEGSLIANDFWLAASLPTPGTAYTTPAGSNAAFSSWLNTQYANGANAGQFAFVRLSPDVVNPPRSGYFLATANSGDANLRPFLSYDFVPVPEPGTVLFAALALGSISMGRRRRNYL